MDFVINISKLIRFQLYAIGFYFTMNTTQKQRHYLNNISDIIESELTLLWTNIHQLTLLSMFILVKIFFKGLIYMTYIKYDVYNDFK